MSLKVLFALFGYTLLTAAINCTGNYTIGRIADIEALVNCKTFNGTVNIEIRPTGNHSDPLLQLDLTGLEIVTGNLTCENNQKVKGIYSGSLSRIGGNLIVEDYERLTNVSFPVLESIKGNLSIVGRVESLSIPSIKEVCEYTIDVSETGSQVCETLKVAAGTNATASMCRVRHDGTVSDSVQHETEKLWDLRIIGIVILTIVLPIVIAVLRCYFWSKKQAKRNQASNSESQSDNMESGYKFEIKKPIAVDMDIKEYQFDILDKEMKKPQNGDDLIAQHENDLEKSDFSQVWKMKFQLESDKFSTNSDGKHGRRKGVLSKTLSRLGFHRARPTKNIVQ